MHGEADLDLPHQLRRREVPVNQKPVKPRRPAVARELRRRRHRRRRHHHRRDVPLVPLQLRHLQTHSPISTKKTHTHSEPQNLSLHGAYQHAGGGAEDGDGAAGAVEEETPVGREGRRRGDVALAAGDHGGGGEGFGS